MKTCKKTVHITGWNIVTLVIIIYFFHYGVIASKRT